MTEWNSSMKGIVDGHVHMGSVAEETSMLMIRCMPSNHFRAQPTMNS